AGSCPGRAGDGTGSGGLEGAEPAAGDRAGGRVRFPGATGPAAAAGAGLAGAGSGASSPAGSTQRGPRLHRLRNGARRAGSRAGQPPQLVAARPGGAGRLPAGRPVRAGTGRLAAVREAPGEVHRADREDPSVMKILILGAGQVGSSVAASLASENNDITVVDTDTHRL